MTICTDRTHLMSAEQQAIWMDDLLHPARPRFKEAWVWDVEGTLDADTLALAFDDVVQRHQSLRTALVIRDGRPTTVTEPAVQLDTAIFGVNDSCPGIDEVLAMPLPVDRAPLVRVTILQHTARRSCVIASWHHAAVDGWSMGLLARDLSAAYRQRLAGVLPNWPQPAGCAGCWAAEQARQMSRLISESADFWRQQLADVRAASRFEGESVTDVDPVPGAKLHFSFSAAQSAALERTARSLRCGTFVLMVTAMAASLWSRTGQRSVVIGCPVSRRGSAETAEVVGCLTDVTLLVLHIDPAATLRQNLLAIRAVVWETLEHSAVPLQTLRESLGRQQVPLPDVVIGFDDVSNEVELPGLSVHPLPFDDGTAKYGVFCEVVRGTPLSGSWQYRADQYSPQQAREHACTFRQMLVATTERIDDQTSDIGATGHAAHKGDLTCF